ncbi:hypothetical protein A0O34_14035 [Chryseobacterium glaciei]|uniref:O-antigen ligase-related domain-containing protein n=1 Tax=Chryseobacterium glaciei TaxID=1685010 RepID=A0A172XX78_9FLAO|nr:O-antigen ligase family protein [Chryseobacterium glaciei]ANF51554.1 hypothetical protein A0O34_14035 [Chryseobacterium glaciei]
MERINRLKSSIVNKKETYFLFITLFGYILAYIDPFELEVLPHFTNLLLRGGIFISSIYFIAKNFEIVKERKYVIIYFLLFYIFYIIKVIYSFQNFYFIPKTFQGFKESFYYFGLIVIPLPVLALLSLNYQKVDFKKFYRIVFYFFLIILGINLLFIGKPNGNRSGIFRSYYILTGHYGLSLVFISLFSYLFLNKNKKIYLLGIVLGCVPMFVSAARSPVLTFFLILLVFFILINKRKYWFYLSIGVILSIFSLFVIYINGLGDDIVFFKRINAAIFQQNGSGRSYYLNKGIDIFINNPWFGGRVLFEDGTYPHNLFVDVLMSTGVLGMILFIIYFKFVIQNFIKILKNIYKYKERGILAFFFFQYFILIQTSGNIYSSFEFWYFGAAIIGLGYINLTNEEIKSSNSCGNTTGNY